WGLDRFLFTDNQVMTPLAIAPFLGRAISWVLAIIVIALLVVTLRAPGTDSLAMWNIMGALVLLIPVSHLGYRILMLPLLWVWAAHALRDRRPRSILSFAILTVFWVVTFRLAPLDAVHTGGTAQYILVMATTLLALSVSVINAARMTPTDDFGDPLRLR
ncbi:MAG: hypothetical protein KKH75_10135, partial [Actinobacteria bacterium]|nr:hypothetical protein [Actinomycetota bacterium]